MKRKKEREKRGERGGGCEDNRENEENVVIVRGWNSGKFVMDNLPVF
jgi:hypothetical protein